MADIIKAVEIVKPKSVDLLQSRLLEVTMENYNAKGGDDYGFQYDAILIDEKGNVSVERGILSKSPSGKTARESEAIGKVNEFQMTPELHKKLVDTGIVLYYDIAHYEIFVDKVSTFDSLTIFVPL